MPSKRTPAAPARALREPTEQWISAISDHIFRTGLPDVSLRQLAAIAGTTHRVLIYYFGSRDGVLAAVLRHARKAEADSLVREAPDRRTGMRAAWAYYAEPQRELELRIFFYLAGHVAAAPGTQPEFVEGVVSTWVEALTELGRREGVAADEAEIEARLLTGAARGLFLDRLLTGDTAAVDRAFERLLDKVLETA